MGKGIALNPTPALSLVPATLARAIAMVLGAGAAVAVLVVPIVAQAPGAPVVERAAQYVAEFIARFSRVVAEERYVQDSRTQGLGAAQHRELVADFLLVRADEMSGWTVFRDVFEVNRVALRDRAERLTTLFLESPNTAVAQAAAINKESARYNIGPQRTINSPLLPLAFLQDMYRSRFLFSVDRRDRTRIDGREVAVVEYTETGRPTIIRGSRDSDVPSHGRYWIDEQSGLILKAELAADVPALRSRIAVTFRYDERFALGVPLQMDEEYITKEGAATKATAKYDHFRRFEVKTEEQIR